jgi:hypothetical protein
MILITRYGFFTFRQNDDGGLVLIESPERLHLERLLNATGFPKRISLNEAAPLHWHALLWPHEFRAILQLAGRDVNVKSLMAGLMAMDTPEAHALVPWLLKVHQVLHQMDGAARHRENLAAHPDLFEPVAELPPRFEDPPVIPPAVALENPEARKPKPKRRKGLEDAATEKLKAPEAQP